MKNALSIISILIHCLEGFPEQQNYTIDELAKRTALDRDTVQEYLAVLRHVQSHAPIIEVPTQDSFRIHHKPSHAKFDAIANILLHLFYLKAFHPETSAAETYAQDSTPIKLLVDHGDVDLVIQLPNQPRYCLTNQGRRRAFHLHKLIMDALYTDYLKITRTCETEE